MRFLILFLTLVRYGRAASPLCTISTCSKCVKLTESKRSYTMESKSKTFTEINEQVLMRFILEKGFFGDFLCPRILAHEECCHGHATATGF